MENKNPLVCICIPCYNNEDTIQFTLDSIANQSYPNIIVKIIDNASTDKSIYIINDWLLENKNAMLIENTTNIGAEKNFNKCFDMAEGNYIAVFHSDDVYCYDMIQRQVDFLEENTNCVAVSTLARIIDEKGSFIRYPAYPEEFLRPDILSYDFNDFFNIVLEYGNVITCPSVLSRTNEIKNKIKYWDYSHFNAASDLDVWLRLAKEGRFGVIKDYLMDYRVSNASYSYRNRNSYNLNDFYLVTEYYLNYLNYKKKVSDEVYSKYIISYNNHIFIVNLRRRLLNKKEMLSYKELRWISWKNININLKRLALSVLTKTKHGKEYLYNRYMC